MEYLKLDHEITAQLDSLPEYIRNADEGDSAEFAAVDEGQLAGILALRISGGEKIISYLYVIPERRLEGIGSSLIQMAELMQVEGYMYMGISYSDEMAEDPLAMKLFLEANGFFVSAKENVVVSASVEAIQRSKMVKKIGRLKPDMSVLTPETPGIQDILSAELRRDDTVREYFLGNDKETHRFSFLLYRNDFASYSYAASTFEDGTLYIDKIEGSYKKDVLCAVSVLNHILMIPNTGIGKVSFALTNPEISDLFSRFIPEDSKDVTCGKMYTGVRV